VSHPNHQITPSPSVLAQDLKRQLRTIADALASVERHLKQQDGPPVSTDAIAIAREHVEQAIAALDLAGRG
jgi:hypothetical protein